MAERSPFDRDEYLAVASDALSAAGIDHDPERLHYNDFKNNVVGGGVSDGSLDVWVRAERKEESGPEHADSPVGRVDSLDNFNGQLRKGWQEVRGEVVRPGADSLYYKADVAFNPTPAQFNHAQRMIGREPGVDALRFKMAPGEAEMSLGVWTPPFADMTVLSADPRVDWFSTTHDLELVDGHGQAWLHSNGDVCRSIARQTGRLMALHGADLLLPKGQRPESLDRLADGLEFLTDLIQPAVRRVEHIAKAAEKGDHTDLTVALRQLGLILDPKTIRSVWGEGNIQELHDRMKALGLATADPGSPQVRPEIVSAVANRLEAVAATALEVDKVWPRHDLTPDQQLARTIALGQVGKTAAMVREKGVEQSRGDLLKLSVNRAHITAGQLLELGSSRPAPAPDTYMTPPQAQKQNEAGRDKNPPQQEVVQALNIEPTPPQIAPAPLIPSALEAELDQAAARQAEEIKLAADKAQLRQQEQALANEIDRSYRGRG